MSKFRYIGAECVYPNIIIDGKSLVAKPGDVREFDTPPDPVWWVKEDEPAEPGKAKLTIKDVK